MGIGSTMGEEGVWGCVGVRPRDVCLCLALSARLYGTGSRGVTLPSFQLDWNKSSLTPSLAHHTCIGRG